MRPAVVGFSAMLLVAVVAFGGQSPEVISGTASFVQDGASWTVTTSDQAVIHWGGFSVPAGSTTRFVQPSASSVVINRVVGSSASFINGLLTANGRLALINPNGIRIGSTGVVRAQGFVASTLANVSNEQIFVGRDLDFKGASTASIENYGRIEALGGDVHLIAHRVVNAGTVSAPGGRVGMAAGNDVLLTQDGKLFVKVSADDVATGGTGVDAGGVVEAVQVELAAHGNMYALAINTEGIVRAMGISRSADGRITLRGAGGSVRTNGRLAAKTVDDSGVTRGGTVQIVARDIEIGGSTVIDVSGEAGGGTVHVGGGVRGAGPLPNARTTSVGAGAEINADATVNGDGGEVVLWADGTAQFFGRITARGGASGGDGGFVEVSGKEALVFRGAVDTTAPGGAAGTLLLDPTDVVLRPGSGDGGSDGTDVFAGPGGPDGTVGWSDPGPSVIYQSELEGLAGATNVRVEASRNITMDPFGSGNPLTFAGGPGTVSLIADADGNSAGDFTMAGGDRIVTNGRTLTISGHNVTVGKLDTGGGKLALAAGANLTAGSLTAGQLRARAGQAGAGSDNSFGPICADDTAIRGGAGDDKFAFAGIAGGRFRVFGRAGDDTMTAEGVDHAVEFHGGRGDDYLRGGRGDDKLWGGRGDDELVGGKGHDKLWGGRGDDCLAGGRGDDKLWGGRGDDKLLGGEGDDKLWGGRGDDYLAGGKGHDKLWGGRGDDELVGGKGHDKLWGGRGDDCLAGGAGEDKLWGGRGDDVLRGGRGDDKLWGGRGDDKLLGGAGDDKLWGGRGDDKLDGQAGDDKLWGGRGDDVLCGGAGDDKLWGGRGDDKLAGQAGDDRLWGGRGDDVLCGGRGDDKLWGGRGDDYLAGGRGDDKLWGGRGDDELVGGKGHDKLWGGCGDDKLVGGKGHDKLWGGRGDDYLAGGAGDDKLWGGRGDDKLDGQAGDDKLWGGRGDDCLAGGRGDDKLWGGRGDDVLCGGPGNDKLWGGRGDDKLDGQAGDDKLWGGRGDDVLCGGRGDDKLWGGRGDDKLCGGMGYDRLWGGCGDDILCRGPGKGCDKLRGGPGCDKIIKHPCGFCGFCRCKRPCKRPPRPPPPGRPLETRRPPVWWDITNRTEEWITASDDGHMTPAPAEVLREYEPVRFWAEPLADVMDMMNAHFDAVVLAREHMNFYAWR